MEHLEHKKKIIIMIAIMSAMLFAALNQTIVGTALPRIVSDLGGMEYYSWVFTIFMLASSITAILVGKLSDIYGRKPFILIGIGIFIIGSLLCGLSETIFHLITYRGIQGFGAGMIMSTAFTAIGDLFPPRERGKWQGLMGSVFGLASVFGPTLGGWIVDHIEWHWVFWVFLPFGIIAFAMIFFLFPSTEKQATQRVDYLGSILLTLTIVPLLLALTWGGNGDLAWSSPSIIALFVGALIALIFFMVAESKAASPVLPLSLFKNKIFTVSNIVGFILGAGMFGAIMYMPMFVQGVMGTSATKSGFVMMPMTLSMVAASTIAGQLMTKTGKYKWIALLGFLTMGSGMISLSFMDMDTTVLMAVINMIVVGFGLGLCFPVFTLAVQNAVSHRLLGVATASTQLFRQIGGTVGVAVLGTILNRSIEKEMNASLPKETMDSKVGELMDPQILMDPEVLSKIKQSLPIEQASIFEQLIQFLRVAFSTALTHVFLVGACIVLIGLIGTFFLKEIPLRQTNQETEEIQAEKHL